MLKDDLKENWKPYLTILIVIVLIWISLILSICDSANAQTLEYTTITFTDADDLGKQVCALERCDTVNTGIWFWTHIDSPAIYIAGEDSITCREVAYVVKTREAKQKWFLSGNRR